MKSPSPKARLLDTGAHFRNEIEKAEAAGAVRADMILRLTLSDVSRLRRDRNIAVTDISYVDGVMRFLGVRVDEGGVTTSVLSSTQDLSPADESAKTA
jgi:hypothetical protein